MLYLKVYSISFLVFSKITPNVLFIYLFVFGCACGRWKFPGQGLNPHHSSGQSHCSDNSGSSTHCTTRELHLKCFKCRLFKENIGRRRSKWKSNYIISIDIYLVLYVFKVQRKYFRSKKKVFCFRGVYKVDEEAREIYMKNLKQSSKYEISVTRNKGFQRAGSLGCQRGRWAGLGLAA